jgi:hypothetical protein
MPLDAAFCYPRSPEPVYPEVSPSFTLPQIGILSFIPRQKAFYLRGAI